MTRREGPALLGYKDADFVTPHGPLLSILSPLKYDHPADTGARKRPHRPGWGWRSGCFLLTTFPVLALLSDRRLQQLRQRGVGGSLVIARQPQPLDDHRRRQRPVGGRQRAQPGPPCPPQRRLAQDGRPPARRGGSGRRPPPHQLTQLQGVARPDGRVDGESEREVGRGSRHVARIPSPLSHRFSQQPGRVQALRGRGRGSKVEDEGGQSFSRAPGQGRRRWRGGQGRAGLLPCAFPFLITSPGRRLGRRFPGLCRHRAAFLAPPRNAGPF